jgi:hypothetical protein
MRRPSSVKTDAVASAPDSDLYFLFDEHSSDKLDLPSIRTLIGDESPGA